MPRRTTKPEPKPKSAYKTYIPLKKFNLRRKAWADYYLKVYKTKAYKRFEEQKEAFKKGQTETVKELAEKARQDLIDNTQEIPEPPYPDPTIERRYYRLGVNEWDRPEVRMAREVFSE